MLSDVDTSQMNGHGNESWALLSCLLTCGQVVASLEGLVFSLSLLHGFRRAGFKVARQVGHASLYLVPNTTIVNFFASGAGLETNLIARYCR
jgi:hypothetical protein